MSRDISKFKKPYLILDFIEKCEDKLNLKVIITSVDRDYKEQFAYFCQGRESLEITNNARRIVGLVPITEEQNMKKVTWTMNSKHVINLDDERKDNDWSEAFDFAIVKNEKAIWNVKADINNDDIPDYEQCALLGESLGLKSGMRFKNIDLVHLELI